MTTTDQLIHIAFRSPARVILQDRSTLVYAATGRFAEGPAFIGEIGGWLVFRTRQIFTAKGDGVTATSIAIDIHVSIDNVASIIAVKESK